MPLFEQLCLECGCRYELLVIGSEKPFCCPDCGSQKSERLASTFAPLMKSPRFGSYRGDAANAFENFTLQHVFEKNCDGQVVRDEKGKPKRVKVNSLKELREAEKKYNFSLVAASEDGSNIDDAPTNESWAGDITHGYERKWAKSPEEWTASMKSDVVKMDVGIASSREETLAGRDAA